MGGLNPEQQAVVDDYRGARAVLAGPGAGKTSTMVELIHNLIDAGVPAANIRAVTFSKEMAAVLEKRVKVKGIVSTLHSLGYQICSETNRKPVEPELRHRLMFKLTRKWGLEYNALDAFIAKMRHDNITPKQAAEKGEWNYGSVSAYAEYERVRLAEGWMDFDSMLCDSVRYLETPQNRPRWQFEYLVVDEAQDTDDLQWRLMQLLSEKHGNITVVGDPNQCQPAGTLVRTPSGLKDISKLANGDEVLSWTKHDQRIYIRSPKKITRAERFYRGWMLTLRSNGRRTRVTPNHFVWVRFAPTAFEQAPYFVYLMWRHDLGFRVGTSHVRRNRSGSGFLTIRGIQERAERMWILDVVRTKQDAETLEEMVSLRYQIPECMFHSYNGCKKTSEQIAAIFECANPQGGHNCLRDYGRLFDQPLASWPSEKYQKFHGYFRTAAANVLPGLMLLPTEQVNGSAMLDAVDREKFCGTVYSLDVEKDHTYVADGIPVGNCIYQWRGAKPDNLTHFEQWFPKGKYFYLGRNYRSTQTIVNFVRENAPRDCPKELLEKMLPARSEVGAPIGLKMYWNDDAEAESALKLATVDPLNSIILARTNRMIGALERICNRHNVRYHLLGKSGFWKQNEIRKAVEKLKDYPTLPVPTAMGFVMPTVEAHYAVDDRTDRDNDALENLQVLKEIGKGFPTAKDFCVYANKMMHRRNDPRGVTISTIHQAKGGEWKNVFVIGAKAGMVPHKNGDEQEEARIWFVAISRAIDFLRISFAGTPSKFVRRYLTDEITKKLEDTAHEVEHLQAQTRLFS